MSDTLDLMRRELEIAEEGFELLKEEFEIIERFPWGNISIEIEFMKSEPFVRVHEYKDNSSSLLLTKNDARALAKMLVKFVRKIERAETAETLALLRQIKTL